MSNDDQNEKDIYDKITENDEGNPEPESGESRLLVSAASEIYDWMETFVFALCVVVILFTFIFRIVTVEGHSMIPTLQDKDRLMISDMLYKPKTGDIIVVQTDQHENPLVKRVIATEGQTVDIDFNNWRVTVDDVTLDEPYINYIQGEAMSNGFLHYPFTVSKGHIFVMGDNRNNSDDSRRIGEIDARRIIGHVMLRIYPFQNAGLLKSGGEN